MTSRKKPDSSEISPRFSKSSDFRSVYINNIQVEASAVDFRLVMGEASNEGSTIHVEQKISIVLSPLEVKLLINMLTSNMATYEQRIGPIRVPEVDTTIDPTS